MPITLRRRVASSTRGQHDHQCREFYFYEPKGSVCCLAKNVAFLQNLGQREEIVSLVCDRHQIRFDLGYCTENFVSQDRETSN